MTVTVTTVEDVDGVEEVTRRWIDGRLMDRLWSKDPTVWFDPPRDEISDRLGWLDLPTTSRALIEPVRRLARAATAEGVTHVVLCGMGGSSLAPEVFGSTLPRPAGSPTFTVVDTTHPDAVASVGGSIDPRTTWFVISSKSGGTLETMSLFRYFWEIVSTALDRPGDHFIAITDEGSSLDDLATDRGFRAVIHADPTVGGRYSALSAFGLVPIGILGVDIERLLGSAEAAAGMCDPNVPLEANPGFRIGAHLGTAALRGSWIARFDATEPVTELPVWIEQLIAESTGKDGSGIVPVAGGPDVPEVARDRVVTVSIGERVDTSADVRIQLTDVFDVAGVMVILELATAVAGEILGIHPFDQPDVQLAKTLAHQAMEGSLPASSVAPRRLGTDRPTGEGSPEPIGASSYIAVQAYLAPTPDATAALEVIRQGLVASLGVMTTTGYGPRFLHSTGQLHKGGPPGGVSIQIVDTPVVSVPVPETDFSFNELIAAQEAGDRAALEGRGRRVVAFDIGRSSLTTVSGDLLAVLTSSG